MLLPVHWDIYGQCQAPAHCIRKFTSPRLAVSKVRGKFSSILADLKNLNKWLCSLNIPISSHMSLLLELMRSFLLDPCSSYCLQIA